MKVISESQWRTCVRLLPLCSHYWIPTQCSYNKRWGWDHALLWFSAVFLSFISTVQVNSFFKMSCFFWWLRFELCQSLLPPFQRSRLIWNFFKISSDLVQCRHPYVKNLFNFFLQRKVPRYPKRMDEMVIWVGLVAGAPKGREKLLISGRTLSPLKKHAEQKHAIKTQHMLYFWKAGVQGCQIWHSHVSIPFNSAPAHLTRLHNAKKLFMSSFQANFLKIRYTKVAGTS